MSDITYDRLKFIALLVAPVIVLVSALCTIWNIPYCEQICATLAAIDTFIGAVVVIANKNYKAKMENNGQ